MVTRPIHLSLVPSMSIVKMEFVSQVDAFVHERMPHLLVMVSSPGLTAWSSMTSAAGGTSLHTPAALMDYQWKTRRSPAPPVASTGCAVPALHLVCECWGYCTTPLKVALVFSPPVWYPLPPL